MGPSPRDANTLNNQHLHAQHIELIFKLASYTAFIFILKGIYFKIWVAKYRIPNVFSDI
jgi:hypothetical protein